MRSGKLRLAAALSSASALILVACSDGASSDPALHSRMRVLGAQFVPGATPSSEAGPEVAALDLLTNTIWPGYADKPMRGTLGASATAAALALSGDAGYWLIPAGIPDVAAPSLPTFRCSAAFSRTLPEPAYTLEVRAVDEQGQFGPRERRTLTVLPNAPSRTGAGQLWISLSWDNEADLDLHVLDPLGHEIYHGAPSSVDAFAPGASDQSAGILEFDSNADCASDQLRQEDVVWQQSPPSGRYAVRVDSASLCGNAIAHWSVNVTLLGVPLAAAAGVSLDSDTWGPHDRGAGLLALGFDVP